MAFSERVRNRRVDGQNLYMSKTVTALKLVKKVEFGKRRVAEARALKRYQQYYERRTL